MDAYGIAVAIGLTLAGVAFCMVTYSLFAYLSWRAKAWMDYGKTVGAFRAELAACALHDPAAHPNG